MIQKLQIQKAGGYDQLKIVEAAPLPPCEPQQVKVKVAAVGVNYADCLVRWGVYESAKQLIGWPITPGFEFSGTIIEIGRSVTDFRIGEEVFGVQFFNSYCSEVVVPEHQVFKKPADWDLKTLAGFPVVFITAYHALFQLVKIYPGAHVLVHSAAGGVGSALVQLAKIKGFQVTGVVGSSHKVPYLRELGADHVIDKSTQNLWVEAERISPLGYDAIFDANGFETYKRSYDHLKPTGKLVCYGNHNLLPKGSRSGRMDYLKAMIGLWQTPKFDPFKMITENKSVVGFNISFLFSRKDMLNEFSQDILQWIQEGKIKPLKTSFYPFEKVAEAHRQLESGQSVGKIVLTF